MTVLDLDALLAPISDATPCGEAVDYDLDFLELEIAVKGKPAQEMGGSVIAAEPPDWKAVLARALALARRTQDLRVGVFAARAAMNIAGFDGLRQGLDLLHGYIGLRWNDVHPRPDADDGEDQTVRLGALANLCDRDEFIAELRGVRVTDSKRFGRLSYRDFAEAHRKGQAKGVVNLQEIDAAFSETDPAVLEKTSSDLSACTESLANIEREICRQVDNGEAVRLDPLADTLRQIRAWNESYRTATEQPVDASVPVEATPPANEIRSRGDIVGMLDRICRWYRQHEPASPVPALLERSMRLVSKDFLALLVELAPDGAAQYRSLAGLLPDGTPRA